MIYGFADRRVLVGMTTIRLAGVALAAVILSACGGTVAPPPTGTEAPLETPTPQETPVPSAPVDLAFGPWRPPPVKPSPAFAAAALAGCRTIAAVGALPLAVLDARGAGFATLVFAATTDASATAVLCHASVGTDGTARADARPVIASTAATPPKGGILGLHDIEVVNADLQRTVLVGQVVEPVTSVEVNFDDATWKPAAKANGWYAIWWPGQEKALGVAASDNHSIVIDGYTP